MSIMKDANLNGLDQTPNQPQLANLAELRLVLGGRLAAVRRARGWSQHQMSVRLGYHQVRIANIELGWKMPSLEILDKYTKILDIALYELLRKPDPWELT